MILQGAGVGHIFQGDVDNADNIVDVDNIV